VTRAASVIAKLALLVTSVVLVLAALEGLVRVTVAPDGDPVLRQLHEQRPDRPWLYGLRPGADVTSADGVRYVVNADGFRDVVRAASPPPDDLRIAVLGDSVAFGYGVTLEQSFPAQLERRIAATRAGPVEVLNLAVNGYNPWSEAALFRDVGVRYRPALVLVQFCINDLNDPTAHFDASTALALGALPPEAFPEASDAARAREGSRVTALCERSRLCTLVARRLGLGRFSLERMLTAIAPRERASDEMLTWLGRRYDEIATVAPSPLVLVVFPWASELGAAAPAALHAQLAVLGREHGWYVIDLLPAFRAAAARDAAPLFHDLWHPTARGHAVAAEAVAAQLPPPGGWPITRSP
jgi:lysophospholipase L1-like esterase